MNGVLTEAEVKAADAADAREEFGSRASRIGRLGNARDRLSQSLEELRCRPDHKPADAEARAAQLKAYDEELGELRSADGSEPAPYPVVLIDRGEVLGGHWLAADSEEIAERFPELSPEAIEAACDRFAASGQTHFVPFDDVDARLVIGDSQHWAWLDLIAAGLDDAVEEADVEALGLGAVYDDHELQNVGEVMGAAFDRLAGGAATEPGAVRFVAVVPSQGSSYHLGEEGALVQVAIVGNVARAPIPGAFLDGDEGEVDWDRGFASDEEAAPVREIERRLRAIPGNLGAGGTADDA